MGAGIELDRDMAARHAKTLGWARAAWFYDYHFSKEDFEAYENALAFFESIRPELKKKAEEGNK